MAAIRARLSGYRAHPFAHDRNGERIQFGWASQLGDEPELTPRVRSLALPAALEALAPLRSHTDKRGAARGALRLFVDIALPAVRPGVEDSFYCGVTGALRQATNADEVRYLARSHAGGVMVIERGQQVLRDHEADVYLVGGIDSYFPRDSLEWLEHLGQLHSVDQSWGMVPGEAAVFCALCTEEVAKQHRWQVLGRILQCANATEMVPFGSDEVSMGKGLSKAIQVLLGAPGVVDSLRIQQTYADLNGDPERANELGFALQRIAHRLDDRHQLITPADLVGDVGAASSLLHICIALDNARFRRRSQPQVAPLATRAPLSNSHGSSNVILATASAPNGERGALLITG